MLRHSVTEIGDKCQGYLTRDHPQHMREVLLCHADIGLVLHAGDLGKRGAKWAERVLDAGLNAPFR